jgi:selenocysteine lyase/cysteine desulfurase
MSRPELIFDPELDFSPTARRFEESASPWYAIAGFLASVRLLESVGHDVVEQRVLANVRELAAGLEDLGYELVEPWPRQAAESSGLVAARHRHRSVEADLARLEAAGVFARVYQDFLRFSPHFYNTDEDLDRALSALDLSEDRRRRAGG